MKKKFFMLLLSLLLVISFAQIPEKGLPLNNLRKLESNSPETILLGFDRYNFTYDSSTRQSNFNFTIHFLLKNWNYTEPMINKDNYIKFNNITLKAIINYQGDEEGKEAEFNCTNNTWINGIGSIYNYLESEDNDGVVSYSPYYRYYHSQFLCDYNLTGKGIPKKITIIYNPRITGSELRREIMKVTLDK